MYTYSLLVSVECAAVAGTVVAAEIAADVWPVAVAVTAVVVELSVAAVAVVAGALGGLCSGQPSVEPSRQ